MLKSGVACFERRPLVLATLLACASAASAGTVKDLTRLDAASAETVASGDEIFPIYTDAVLGVRLRRIPPNANKKKFVTGAETLFIVLHDAKVAKATVPNAPQKPLRRGDFMYHPAGETLAGWKVESAPLELLQVVTPPAFPSIPSQGSAVSPAAFTHLSQERAHLDAVKGKAILRRRPLASGPKMTVELVRLSGSARFNLPGKTEVLLLPVEGAASVAAGSAAAKALGVGRAFVSTPGESFRLALRPGAVFYALMVQISD